MGSSPSAEDHSKNSDTVQFFSLAPMNPPKHEKTAMSAPRRLNFIHTSNGTGVPDLYGAASVCVNQLPQPPRIFDTSAKSAKSAPTIPNSTSSRLESMLTLGTSGTKEGSITANRTQGSCTDEVLTRSTHSAGFESNTSNQVTLLALGYVGGSSGNRTRAVASKAPLLDNGAIAGSNYEMLMPREVKVNRRIQQLDAVPGSDEEQAVQEIEMPQDPLCGLRRPNVTSLQPLVSPPALCLDGASCSDSSLRSQDSVSSGDDFPTAGNTRVARRPPPLRLASYHVR